MNNLSIAWRFSRPHTVIGSTLSTLSLFIMAYLSTDALAPDLQLLLFTLISALACNIYIVGLNQITDLDLDRKNKPHLPLASGEMKMSTAKRVVVVCGLLSLFFGLAAGWLMLVLVVIVGALGTAYSLPPLKFKKNHLWAALSITLVRGVLVNVLMFVHFEWELDQETFIPIYMYPLILLMILFSIGIAWFKDIPDVVGDKEHSIQTMPVERGVRWAYHGAVSLVSLAYLTVVLWAGVGIKGYDSTVLAGWHALALIVLWFIAYQTNPFEKKSVTRFYRAYWVLFFLEYMVYPIGMLG